MHLLLGTGHAQAVFFIPYLSLSNAHERPMDDVYALGKTMFICMIGVVSLEVRRLPPQRL